MTNPGAGVNKIFVAPAPEKYLKRLQLQLQLLLRLQLPCPGLNLTSWYEFQEYLLENDRNLLA